VEAATDCTYSAFDASTTFGFSDRNVELGRPGSKDDSPISRDTSTPTSISPATTPETSDAVEPSANSSPTYSAEISTASGGDSTTRESSTPRKFRTGKRKASIPLELGRDLRGYAEVDVQGLAMKGLLDSGSGRTIVNSRGAQTLRNAGLEMTESPFSNILVANADQARILGEFSVPFRVGEVTRVVEVLHVPTLSTPLLLGIDFWRRFHLRPDFVEETCEVGSVELPEEEAEAWEDPVSQSDPENESVLTEEQRGELREILEAYLLFSSPENWDVPKA